MDPQNLFKIVVVLYSVSNLLSLGIELNLKETIRSLKSFRLIILTLFWGWVVCPAFAYLLTKILPMDPSIALGLLITSVAPVAPFFPILVRNARADVNFSAAFMPLTMVSYCSADAASCASYDARTNPEHLGPCKTPACPDPDANDPGYSYPDLRNPGGRQNFPRN